MRDVGSTDLTKIGRGEYPSAELLLFDLASGLYGFWNGRGPLVVNGVTYVGAASVLEVERIDSASDLSASPLQVKLRAVPETGLTSDILATIEDEDYKNAPVTLSIAYFNRDTGATSLVLPVWRGYIDTILHDETPGGAYALVANLEPASIDHSRTGHETRSDEAQRRIDPDDLFYEHAATAGTETIYYGRANPATPAASGFDRVLGR
jgi:hypothetical protein